MEAGSRPQYYRIRRMESAGRNTTRPLQ